MQNNINPPAQHKRRQEAWLSVIAATVIIVIGSALFLTLGCCLPVAGWLRVILLLIGLSELGMLIPVWKLLKIRLLEIEGGEEDAAAQY